MLYVLFYILLIMLKPFFAGLSALALVATGATYWVAQAQSIPTVRSVCPDAQHMDDFEIGEFKPLASGAVYTAEVTGDNVNVRQGAWMGATVAFKVSEGAQVEVLGEAWDQGCNAWLKVDINNNDYWISRSYLQPVSQSIPNWGQEQGPRGIGPKESPSDPPQTNGTNRAAAAAPPRVVDACNADWAGNARLYDQLSLAPIRYYIKLVNEPTAEVKEGSGFSQPTEAILNQGTPLIVTGEAWDADCHHWLRIQTGWRNNRVAGWVHGDALRDL